MALGLLFGIVGCQGSNDDPFATQGTGKWIPIAQGGEAGEASPNFWTGSEILHPAQDLMAYLPGEDRWEKLFSNFNDTVGGGITVWTGAQLLDFGGAACGRISPEFAGPCADGYVYDLATSQSKMMNLQGEPSARAYATGVWTGKQLFVWGGDGQVLDSNSPSGVDGVAFNDGALYDPSADTWTPIQPAPAVRGGVTAIWTGSRILVWGGLLGTTTPQPLPLPGTADLDAGSEPAETPTEGWAYDPGADQWSLMASAGQPSNREAYAVVWTGTEMIVWGGAACTAEQCEIDYYPPLADGAAYNPSTDTWRPIRPAPNTGLKDTSAVWTGTEMLVWGGFNGSGFSNQGYRYNPTTDTWGYITTVGAPSPRIEAGLVWTGQSLFVWDGTADLIPPADGAQWFPEANGGWVEPADAEVITGGAVDAAGAPPPVDDAAAAGPI